MKKTVWKFPLGAYDFKIDMPKGSQILCVQIQNNIACLWALVDPNATLETRWFEVYGTGHTIWHDMGIDRNYIGTFQLDGGELVFHVFERIN